MSIRKTLLAATMLALPLAAQAQPVNGLYVAAGAGANWHQDFSPNLSSLFGGGLPIGFDVSTSTGWAVVTSVGWGFGNGLRVEGEGNYRNNDVSSITVTSPVGNLALQGRTGSVSTFGIMANVFYDFRVGPLMPYVGAGIGHAWYRADNVGVNISGVALRSRGTDGVFAYQAIAGVALPITQVPGLALTLEYRYFGTADGYRTVTASSGGESVTLGAVKAPNQNQSLLLGVRYNFGRTPAAPPPPVVQPASSFIVFFDFNRDDLTARAREIVAQAAQAARSQQVTRIEVAGHTDTVGSAQYNQGLSQRRANTVAAELVRQGVPREAIHTAGYGFSRPLVPTGPNVREPQNRRVEITFR